MKQISDVDTTTSSRPLLVVCVVMDRPRWRTRNRPKHVRPRIGGRAQPRSLWHTALDAATRPARRQTRAVHRAWHTGQAEGPSGGTRTRAGLLRARLRHAVLPHLGVERRSVKTEEARRGLLVPARG